MSQAIRLKYLMIPYYYTEMYFIHIDGGSLFNSLFHEFPTDPKSYLDNYNNIMIGPGLKASILTNSSAHLGQYDFYFPKQEPAVNQTFDKPVWCNMIIY